MCGRLDRLRKLYNRQPQVIVYQPVRINKNPEPTPFEVSYQGKKIKGFILRKDEDPRVMGKRGSSFQITIPEKWVSHLKRELRPFLIQIQNSLGIVFFDTTEEGVIH